VSFTIFGTNTAGIFFSRSTDGGRTFSPARLVSQATGENNTYSYLDVDPQGALYLEYDAYGNQTIGFGTAYVLVSKDGGVTFGAPVPILSIHAIPVSAAVGLGGGALLPNTTFRDGIFDFFAASRTRPGYLYVAAQQWDAQNGTGTPTSGKGDYDIVVYRSTDAGKTWQNLGFANDPITVGDATDQFQPTVSTDSSGHVAVSFFDRRNACPTTQPAPNYYTRPGATNYCIQTSLQWYDDATGTKLGGNIILGQSWDPQEPSNGPAPAVPQGSTIPLSYISDIPHSVYDPCYNNATGFYLDYCQTFIGDFFGVAVSNGTAYILNISTYPTFQQTSNVTAWSQANSVVYSVSPYAGGNASSIQPAANNYYQQALLIVVPGPSASNNLQILEFFASTSILLLAALVQKSRRQLPLSRSEPTILELAVNE
jgi:hypothetical protein